MPHAYTEDQLVEQPAIGLFAELGWAVAGPPPSAGVAGEPRDAGLLGRDTKGAVVLVSRLRAALVKLNPALPPEAITAASTHCPQPTTTDRFTRKSAPPYSSTSTRVIPSGTRACMQQPSKSAATKSRFTF